MPNARGHNAEVAQFAFLYTVCPVIFAFLGGAPRQPNVAYTIFLDQFSILSCGNQSAYHYACFLLPSTTHVFYFKSVIFVVVFFWEIVLKFVQDICFFYGFFVENSTKYCSSTAVGR